MVKNIIKFSKMKISLNESKLTKPRASSITGIRCCASKIGQFPKHFNIKYRNSKNITRKPLRPLLHTKDF